MKDKFKTAFESAIAANRGGELRNLLITDDDAEFLDEALYQLRSWCVRNDFNLVELDEKDSSWLPEIQSRELFDKLNKPNTVLLIKNYATVNYMRGDDNTPLNFLRDAVMNRHYGCGNDFVPSDELPNLLFAVVINDLSEMNWKSDEYMTFSVIHQDDSKEVWTNTKKSLPVTRMHPVMSAINKTLYHVSEDETALCVDLEKAFRGIPLRRSIRYRRPAQYDKTEIIHKFFESNLPDFRNRVQRLILKMSKYSDEETFVINGRRLLESFPNLTMICCKDNFEIADIGENIRVADPFEFGETIFRLTRDGEIPTVILFLHDLRAIDFKCEELFLDVVRDYLRKPEDHANIVPDGSVHNQTGMDHLFHIYLLGWYHRNEKDKVLVTKHKNFDKAIDLLPIRFRNCDIDEVALKLHGDIQHVENDENPDYDQLKKVLAEADKLCPGVIDKMRERGWLD